MQCRSAFLVLLLLALAAGVVRAQGAAVTAARLEPGESIRLDGTLTHPAWQRARPHEDFVQVNPTVGAPPPQRTRFRVLFDERAMYVGIEAFDTAAQEIRDPPVRADGVNRTQDFVVVYVDAIGSKRAAQFFRVNAAGSVADGIHTAADDSEDFSPDFDWDAAVSRHVGGWTAVLRLPFASLRFAEGAQEWRMMVGRRLPREQFYLVTSVAIPRGSPSFIHHLQPLEGVSLPAQHAFLTLRPSLTLRQERRDGARRSDVDGSLDIKWRPRAEAVVDATLNPDFSQVAIDVPQLSGNTQFALSLPEKRPFFFESADLLRSPTEAFYTRSFTAPRAGLRGTWRGSVWSGSAFAVDDRGGGLLLLPGAYGTGIAAQPASHTLAARAKADQGGLVLGGLAVARRYAGAAGENTVLGPDLAWQIDDAWRLRAQWLHSRSSGLTQGDGDRLYAKLWRQTDDTEFNLTLDQSDADFRHDTGFVPQAGVRRVTAFGSRTWRPVGPFNEFALNLQVEQAVAREGGEVVLEDIRPGLWSLGASNLEWWLEAHPWSRVRPAPGKPLLHERYVQTGLVYTPASWLPLLDTNLAVGRLADVVAEEVRTGLRWTTTLKIRPLRRLEFEPTVAYAALRDDGRLAYREWNFNGLAVWHFDARQTLRAIVQHGGFFRGSAPGSPDARRIASLTYAWRQSAGTVLYVGASRSRLGDPTSSRTTEAFVKLQFDVDEARAVLRP